MLQSFLQFKPLIAQNIHFISKSFNSTAAQLQSSNVESGSSEPYRCWIGKIPAYDDEIKRAVEYLVREGEATNRPNIMRAIQQENDRRAREMKSKKDPFAW